MPSQYFHPYVKKYFCRRGAGCGGFGEGCVCRGQAALSATGPAADGVEHSRTGGVRGGGCGARPHMRYTRCEKKCRA